MRRHKPPITLPPQKNLLGIEFPQNILLHMLHCIVYIMNESSYVGALAGGETVAAHVHGGYAETEGGETLDDVTVAGEVFLDAAWV